MAYDIPQDDLRDGLNLASTRFVQINAGDFDNLPALGIEFLHLRLRLRNISNPIRPYKSQSISAKNDHIIMINLAADLMSFIKKIEQPEYAIFMSHKLTASLTGTLITVSDPDEWDEDVEGD
jgi:hypothetical protein